MSIKSQLEFEKLWTIGRIVRRAVLARAGAESAPPKVYGFPGAVCITAG
jgi:hypothetical protein